MKHDPVIAIRAVAIDANTLTVESAKDNHSTAAKTGIKRVTIPNNGKNNKSPANPKADLINPNMVADCELIMHTCSQLRVTQCDARNS